MNYLDEAVTKSLDEFMEYYKVVDTEEIYSNGTEFVPIFRVKQWEEYNNKDKEIETWTQMPEYNNIYEISNYGNIRSVDRIVKNGKNSTRIIKGKKIKLTNNGSYYVVGLSKNGETKQRYVHRLVAEAFIPNIYNLPVINHINGNKLDNRVENLEWCTIEYNVKDAWKNNLMYTPKGKENKMYGRYGRKANKSKIVYQYDLQGNLIRKWDCQRDVERELGFSEKCISNCVVGRQKTAYGYVWKQDLKGSE